MFAWLAGAQLMLLLDMVFEVRWQIHGFWIEKAQEYGVYGLRRSPQLLALIALTIGMGCAAAWILPQFRWRKGALLMVAGTMLSLGLWLAEVVSYHDLDRIFYHLTGGAMAISFLWIALTCFVLLGVTMELRG